SATTRPTVPPEQRPTADTLVGRLAAVPSDGVLPRRTLVSGMAEPMADAVLTRLVAARVITTVGTSVRLSHPGIATGWRSAKQLRHERDNGDDHMDLHDQHLLP
ncbi:MAG TPA: hypothetical protein VFX16_32565, partial [Pseudonocardiaceae bacterium]|nr:hypothetical protein [Pseudonocardiaceae bacterium]